MNKKDLPFLSVCLLFFGFIANAAEIDKNTARMQAMDKITGKVSVINVPVNGAIDFGSLSIVIRSCKTRPVEETPENFAFVDITDKTQKGEEINIFKGWMISSSPATNAVEHPIYDVWLLKCLDTEIKPEQLLTSQQLALRDELPMLNRQTAQTAEREKIPEEKDTERTNPMPEMIYQSDSTKDNTTETSDSNYIAEEEFFFDEDTDNPDNTEIQSEIDRIKSDLLTNISHN